MLTIHTRKIWVTNTKDPKRFPKGGFEATVPVVCCEECWEHYKQQVDEAIATGTITWPQREFPGKKNKHGETLSPPDPGAENARIGTFKMGSSVIAPLNSGLDLRGRPTTQAGITVKKYDFWLSQTDRELFADYQKLGIVDAKAQTESRKAHTLENQEEIEDWCSKNL